MDIWFATLWGNSATTLPAPSAVQRATSQAAQRPCGARPLENGALLSQPAMASLSQKAQNILQSISHPLGFYPTYAIFSTSGKVPSKLVLIKQVLIQLVLSASVDRANIVLAGLEKSFDPVFDMSVSQALMICKGTQNCGTAPSKSE